jgi:hypothetical protein
VQKSNKTASTCQSHNLAKINSLFIFC